MSPSDFAIDGAALASVCERYGIATLLVFGSVARGDSRPTSDIDVLYELLPGRRLGWEIEDLNAELERVLGRPVDLVSWSALPRRVRETVRSEARPLYAA